MPKHPDASPSVIDKINKQRAEQDRVEKEKLKELKYRKAAVNAVFSTPNGKVLWRHLMDFCGIFAHDDQLNPAKLIEDRGKRAVILQALRPLIDKKTLEQLEN